MSDLRRSGRKSVIKRAEILIDGASVIGAMVLNITERGARLRTDTPINLPDEVVLRFSGGGTFVAQRRWAQGLDIGFEFAGSANLHGEDVLRQGRAAYEMLRSGSVADAVALLRSERFFDDDGLRRRAEAAEAARADLAAALLVRLEARKPASGG